MTVVALLILSFACSTDKETTIYLKDYLSDHQTEDDAGYALRKALDDTKKQRARKLVLPGGTLRITPKFVYEQYGWISNNDEGLKRIAFNLTGMHDLEIDGQGTTLLFTGYVSPFLIQDASNITIRNLSVDYTRTFHSEGIITGSGENWLDIRFEPEFPYYVADGRLQFRDQFNISYPYSNLLEFDPVKKETAFMAKDHWIFSGGSMPAEQLANGHVRIFKEGLEGTPGNVLVFGASHRRVPCFTLSDSRRVLLSDINIYHCGGMGVIAQRSSDIELNGVKVTPSPGSGRIISITADATHFSNCSGYIRMINCLFENQKDDATNIHGIYAVIDSLLSPSEMIVRLKHSQQHGFNFIKPGVVMELADAKSLITYGHLKVKESEPLNKEYIRVILESAIPDSTQKFDVVAADGAYPDVLIKNCIMRRNRARGLLLGSRGKIVIEDNYFHIAGSAILFEGDGTYWYEQSGVRDVTIRNNIFENCNYGVWGNACISVGSGIRKDQEHSRYHHQILVEKNTFRGFDPRLVNIYCVNGFTFRNNQIENTTDYPYIHQEKRPFVIKNCDNVITR
jgi:hypothetical protein